MNRKKEAFYTLLDSLNKAEEIIKPNLRNMKSTEFANLTSHCPCLAGREVAAVMVFFSHHMKYELGKQLSFRGIGFFMRSSRNMFKKFCSITGAENVLLNLQHCSVT